MEGLKKSEVQNLRMPFITLYFCDSSNTIKALSVASFTRKFIIGHRGVESPNLGDAKEAQKMVEIMKDSRFDPRETLMLQSSICSSTSSLL